MGLDPNSPVVQKLLADAARDGRIVRDSAAGAQLRTRPVQWVPPEIKVRTEKEFQREVIRLARSLGWKKIAHFRNVKIQRRDGSTHYAVPVQEDGTGFLDLELVRERLIKVELKVEPNKPDAAQWEWFDAYLAAGVEAYVWYPEQWQEIVETLTRAGRGNH